MLPVEAVGSPEYFAKLLEDCDRGYQRCFECHVLGCHDNMHPARVAGLERAIIDFHELEYQLRAKIKRLHELNESSKAVTRMHQTEAGERRERMESLMTAIKSNQFDVDMAAEEDMLDASDQRNTVELEAYIDGLQAAYRMLDTDGRVDDGRGETSES